MSMLIFGMACDGEVTIDDMSMIKTSFPRFKEIFEDIGAQIKYFKNIKPVIAIDGTAGSGKGTLAKNLSIKLNFDHLDTGLLYRICAYEIKIKQKEMSKVNIMEYLNNQMIKAELRKENI